MKYLRILIALLLSLNLLANECSAELPFLQDESKFDEIESLVLKAIGDGEMAGAVVCIGNAQGIEFLEAFGQRQQEPTPEPMSTDTLFDLASLTKPMATATSVMLLIEQNKIELKSPVAKYIPEFADNGKDAITIEQLLLHTSGLIPDNALSDYANGPEAAMKNIFALTPRTQPGAKFAYSDVGFIVLAEVIRRVTDQDVHAFSQEAIFQKLGMQETGFNPDAALHARTASTQQRDGKWMKGTVHDPRAFALQGIAGHAGLFSTAHDLALYAQMFLNHGTLKKQQILKPQTIELMTARYQVSSGYRGLGWDKQTGYSSNRGSSMSEQAFGHGGFTGTSIWIDPELDLFVIFLSNRLHPDGKGSVNGLAGRIGTIAANQKIEENQQGNHSPVECFFTEFD